MSDPKRPDDPSRPPIADAASLFDSNVVHAYNPPSDADPAPAADDPASEYGIEALPAAAAPARPVPPRPAPRPAAAKGAAAGRQFAPTDDVPTIRSDPSSRSDAAIRAARQSKGDIDPESDSSDRIPSRSKRRSSDRAIGFDDADDGDAIVAEDDLVEVDPIWTRGAEWGPDLVRVGLVAAATLVAAWFALGVSYGLSALILGVGGAIGLVLCYPLAVTIERPVRITPEQAVKDFFAAASHRLPHYRRMWLLLSPTARSVGRFSNFDEFRASWDRRMAAWKEGRAGKYTPLSFRVVDFRGDKSAGHTTSGVEYTVQVFVRGREGEKPINSYRMVHGAVKGPDRMWYLNQGTLASAGR